MRSPAGEEVIESKQYIVYFRALRRELFLACDACLCDVEGAPALFGALAAPLPTGSLMGLDSPRSPFFAFPAARRTLPGFAPVRPSGSRTATPFTKTQLMPTGCSNGFS